MAAAKGDTDETVFTEDQEKRLGEIIKAAIAGDGGGKPKGDDKGDDEGHEPPSDDEWAKWSPRDRENYVDGRVRAIVRQIKQSDRVDEIAGELDDLKKKVSGKKEGPPQSWSWLTEFLWGKKPENAP